MIQFYGSGEEFVALPSDNVNGDRFMASPRLRCKHNLVPPTSLYGSKSDLCPSTSMCSEFTEVAVNCIQTCEIMD